MNGKCEPVRLLEQFRFAEERVVYLIANCVVAYDASAWMRDDGVGAQVCVDK